MNWKVDKRGLGGKWTLADLMDELRAEEVCLRIGRGVLEGESISRLPGEWAGRHSRRDEDLESQGGQRWGV